MGNSQYNDAAALARRLQAEGVRVMEAPCEAGEWRFDAVCWDEKAACTVLAVHFLNSRRFQYSTPARALDRTERVLREDAATFHKSVQAYRAARAIDDSARVRLDVIVDVVDEADGTMLTRRFEDVSGELT